MIPTEDKIKRALLMELYACKDHAASPEFCYDKLVEYFEEVLEDGDFAPYHNSKNRWANTIQVTRNHLIAEGLILSPQQNKRNEWKLSNSGIKLGRDYFVKAYEEDPWPDQKIMVEQPQSKEEDEALPISNRNYYIIGSKYGDANGNDVVPKIDEFIKNKCVAIGFLDWLDFSPYMGAEKIKVNEFVATNWKEEKPAWHKIQRYFWLLSQIKESDIIAVKSHGAHNQLTIIGYAEVVSRNGSVYEHNEDELGHHIHVDFLDAGFYKQLGLTYAETIHHLTQEKDEENFYKVFGWYADTPAKNADTKTIEVDDEAQADESGYNEKSETSFERSATASVMVNLVHNRIQNRFVRYLMATYPNDINVGERKRIDARRETENELFIYEIKPFESVYACIRDGIGQLLDYSHQQKTKKAKRIIIVGPNEPEQHDLDFIQGIKNVIQIPFGYIAFDEATFKAKEF